MSAYINLASTQTHMRDSPAEVLRLDSVSKVYEGETPFLALDKVSVNIDKGELISIIGPSGSGKSTLLHILGCLDRPTSGELYVDGVEISKLNDDQVADVRRDTIGFVFQSFNLAPTLNVFKNVELPLMIRGMEPAKRQEIVARNLTTVGLTDKAHNLPSQLSGGQKQRVAIARALVNEPKILLADEPTGNLDSKSSREIIDHMVGLRRQIGITVIMVTHDQSIADRTERTIRIMDGKIIEDSRKKRRGAT